MINTLRGFIDFLRKLGLTSFSFSPFRLPLFYSSHLLFSFSVFSSLSLFRSYLHFLLIFITFVVTFPSFHSLPFSPVSYHLSQSFTTRDELFFLFFFGFTNN